VAKFDIDVRELTRYARHLDGMATEGARSFIPIAVEYRDLTRETAKELVRKDTWELHDSIKNTPGEASAMGLNANWHVTAGHASPIEYGFRHWISGEIIGPFPYVRPALDQHRRGYVEALASAAKQRGLTKGKVRAGAGSI
jgi:hypothetical protein